MGLPSKLKIFDLKKKSEKTSLDRLCKRIKSEGFLLKILRKDFELEDTKLLPLKEIVPNLQSPDSAVNISTIDYVRNLFENKKPLSSCFLVNSDLINQIIQISMNKDQENLHLAAIKLIAEVVKKTNGSHGVDISIPYLVRFLEPSISILGQESILALRNIEFISNTSASIFITNRGTTLLLQYVNDQIESSMLKNITFILLKVFKARPIVTIRETATLLHVLQRLLLHPNREISGNVCGILDHLTTSLNGPFNEILETNIIASVVEHLYNWDVQVSMKALNVISNIIYYGTANHVRVVLQYEILSAIPGLLKHEILRNKVFEILVHYLKGNWDDIQKVLDANITESVLEILKENERRLYKQPLTYFRLLAERGKWFQIRPALDMGLITVFCNILCNSPTNSILKMAMITMRLYFNAAKVDIRLMKKILKEAEGLQDRIDNLKELPNLFDVRFEALHLGYDFLAARLWVDENLKSY